MQYYFRTIYIDNFIFFMCKIYNKYNMNTGTLYLFPFKSQLITFITINTANYPIIKI